MKFKEIEPKRNSVAPELDATPYVLSEEEQKMVAGGHNCKKYHYCGEKGQNSCIMFECTSNRSKGLCEEYTWRTELELSSELE